MKISLSSIKNDREKLLNELTEGIEFKIEIFPNFSLNAIYYKNSDETALKSYNYAPICAFSVIDNKYISLCTEIQCILVEISNSFDICRFLSNITDTIFINCSEEGLKYISKSENGLNIDEQVKSMKKYFYSLLLDEESESMTFNKLLKLSTTTLMTYFIRRLYLPSSSFLDSSFFTYSSKSKTNFEKFNPEDFVQLKKLGSGGFGDVRLVFHKTSGHVFAFKSIDSVKKFLIEKKFYQLYQHHCLVQGYGFVNKVGADKGIVMEFMCNGSVSDLIKQDKLDDNLKTKIICRVMYAIDYLHSNGIMHRDIKPQNTLVDHNMEAYLSDFDSAREYVLRQKLTNDAGTFAYMSPEEANAKDYSFNTDLYSLGIFVFELTTGQNPYSGLSLKDALTKIGKGEVPSLSIEYGEISDLFTQLTLMNPRRRYPSFYLLNALDEASVFFKNADHNEMSKFIRELKGKQNTMNENRKDFQSLVEDAEDGDCNSQFFLGNIYYHGIIVKQDYEKALHYYLLSAEQGKPAAMYNVGNWYEYVKKDYKEAFNWYSKAANKGDTDAANGIANLYESGILDKQDYETAFNWIKAAARVGNVYAIHNVGVYYEKGYVEKDYEKAFKWYMKAAKLGDRTAIYNVGHFYEKGYIKRDYTKAMEWYKKGARLGDKHAMNSIGHMYEEGCIEQDYEKALSWYFKAAEAGNVDSMYNIGLYYERGYIERNFEKAFEWFMKAAKLGEVCSMFKVGSYYDDGNVVKDYSKALEWYLKAGEKNNSDAMHNAAKIYLKGKGVEKDGLKAVEWFEKSYKLRDADSASALARIHEKGEFVEKDLAKAEKYFNDAIELSNNDEYHLMNMAAFFYANGHVKEGDMLVNEAIEEDSSTAKFIMGHNLLKQGKNIERGMELLEEAAEDSFGAAELELARIYKKEDDSDEAVDYYIRAADNGVCEACLEVGKLLEIDGKIDEAIQMYHKALFVPNEEADKRLKKLVKQEKHIEKLKENHTFACLTCLIYFDICPHCAIKCHAGHDIIDLGYINYEFDCDCGTRGVNCKFHSS